MTVDLDPAADNYLTSELARSIDRLVHIAMALGFFVGLVTGLAIATVLSLVLG